MNYQKKLSTKELTKDLINKFSILNGAKYFYLEIFQKYLVFIPAKKFIKYFSGTNWIELWKSNRMSEESIENITKFVSNFALTFVDHQLLPDMTGPQLRNLDAGFTLSNCLFGSVKLTKNANLDKYKYACYGIGLDSRSEFLITDGSYGKNLTSFAAEMSSSVHFHNKAKES